MNFLLLCEESQAVANKLRELGHDAYSCDLLPCSGGHPEYHFEMDAFEAAKIGHWDRIISFPPCTDLTVSGARWFEGKRLNGSQEKAIRFFFEIWKISDGVENPIGIMNGGGI